MATKQNSYDFQNQVRSVMPEYLAAQKLMPTLIKAVRIGSPARSTKEEWPELQLSGLQTTIASFATDGTGTGITVADGSIFRINDILYFESSTGVDRAELVRVTNVVGNALTVTRAYGGGSTVTLVVGDSAYLQARPRPEATDAGADDGREATMNFNYTQIVDRTAVVSATAEALQYYDVSSQMNAQVGFHLMDILREQSSSLIRGKAVQRSGSVQGTSGGFMSYLTGGNVETTGGNLSKTHINTALRMIYDDGGYSNAYAIVCAPNQAQRISAFNTAGNNPLVTMDQTNRSTGSYVSSFVGDLPVQSGFMADIFVEPTFPKDKIAILDMNLIEMAWLRPLTDRDATPAGFDGFKRRIIGEFTFRVLNGTTAHAMITGLNV